jgi:CheY-like chemotaxis protein
MLIPCGFCLVGRPASVIAGSFTVEAWIDGRVSEALKIVSGRHFNLILSDIGLPDGTGIDLIRQIRGNSSIPAIALTGFGMDQDIKRYKEAGFDAHLTKPINIQKLEMLINQFFSNGSSWR